MTSSRDVMNPGVAPETRDGRNDDVTVTYWACSAGGGGGGRTLDDSVGYWVGAKRARGSHDGTCLYDQWRWIDFYGRTAGTVSGFTAFVPGKPDK